MAILTVGIDLAKNVFAVHGVNQAGQAEFARLSVAREPLTVLVAALPPCAIGVEPFNNTHFRALSRLFALRRAMSITSIRNTMPQLTGREVPATGQAPPAYV